MNDVKLGGSLGRCYIGDGASGKYAFFSVKPDEGGSFIECVTSGEAAEALVGVKEGEHLSITGKLVSRKDKKTQQWQLKVEAASVEAGADPEAF